MTAEGVKRGKAATRLPAERRWTLEGWDKLRGFPWDVSTRERQLPQPALGDGEARQPVLARPAMAPPEGPRDFYVLAEEVRHFDPTPGCPGCETVKNKVNHPVAHSYACRQRESLPETLEGRCRSA